jgi:hypothetical protein
MASFSFILFLPFPPFPPSALALQAMVFRSATKEAHEEPHGSRHLPEWDGRLNRPSYVPSYTVGSR